MTILLATAMAVIAIQPALLPPPSLLPWTAQHLIGIDTPLPRSTKLSPGQDIVAVYARSVRNESELRVDLLDLDLSPEADLYLALDTGPGGSQDLPIETRSILEFDVLIILPAYGELQVLDACGHSLPGSALRLLRDPEQDSLTLRLHMPQAVPIQHLAVEVLATAPSSPILLDQSGPFLTANPPPEPAMSMLAFWDVYPATTPATALRRWRGAHTGPLGISHGLGYLLGLAQQHAAHLALIDLQRPAVLSALDYSDGLGLVQELNQAGLLILSDQPVLPSSSMSIAQLERSEIIRGFLYPPDQRGKSSQAMGTSGISISKRQCTASVEAETNGSCLQITLITDSVPVADLQVHETSFQTPATGMLIPVYDTPGLLDRGGPSLALRQLLVQAAAESQSPGPAPIMILGGSLPQSEWGAPLLARPTLNYIQNHPWIKLLNAHDLYQIVSDLDETGLHLSANLPTDPELLAGTYPNLAGESQLPLQLAEAVSLQQAVAHAPDNALGKLYLDSTPDLLAGSDLSPQLESVWSLIEAAWWAEQPEPSSDCEHDPDRDSQAECVLSGTNYYLQFDAESGLLTHFFYRSASPGRINVHQIIGPPSDIQTYTERQDVLLIEDLSDVTPQVSTIGPGQVTFAFPNRSIQITYRWLGDRLQIETTSTITALPGINLPLALDPWECFSRGWTNRYQVTPINPHTWVWQLNSEVSVNISAGLTRGEQQGEPDNQAFDLHLTSFLESQSIVRRAENPDQEPPPGFYLPFPLAVIQALPAPEPGSYTITILPSDILSGHPDK